MVTNYKRFENETDEELIYRICSDKEQIGSWKDVGDILNELLGFEYTESKYRKQYQSFQKMLKANQSKFVDADAQLSEIESAREALQKERYKLQATKLEFVRKQRQDSRFELFYENVKEAIELLEPPVFKEIFESNKNNEYVLGIGDIHYGSTFSSENNTYSREECKRRFGVLLSYMKDYITKNNIARLKLVNVADDIQGILRMSDLQINDVDVVQCVVEISQIISQFLNELSTYCCIDYYHVTSSNHTQTRPLGSKASLLAGEDLEKVIANYINDVLVNNDRVNIHFDTNKEYIDFNIFDFQCTSEHGHRVKNVEGYLKDKSILRRKIYSYAFLGHTHSSREIIVGEEKDNNLEVLIIPSFIGSDPYSDSLNVGSKAMAKIFVFNEKYGHVGSENIILN